MKDAETFDAAVSDHVAITRRALLGGAISVPVFAALGMPGPAGAATGPALSEPPRRPTAQDTRNWLALRVRLDGKPSFWFARGTEYVVVDGAATPYNSRIVVLTSLYKDLGGGACELPYFETLSSVTPFDYEFAADHRHPITGDPISTAVSDPVKVSLKVAADGRISNDVVTSSGIRATYRGYFWTSPGFGPQRIATSKIDIFIDRVDGVRDTLSEINTLRQTSNAKLASGFVAADSETLTSRSIPDPQRYGGRAAWTIGSYYARKYPTVDAMRRDMRPVELDKHQAFFDGWEQWARSA